MAKKKIQINIKGEELKRKLNIRDGKDGKDGKDAPIPDTNVVAYEASKMAEEELTKLIPKLDDAQGIADKLNEHEEIIDQKVIKGFQNSLDIKLEEGIAKGIQRGGGSGGIFLYASGEKKGKINTLNFAGMTYSKVNGLDTLTHTVDLSGYYKLDQTTPQTITTKTFAGGGFNDATLQFTTVSPAGWDTDYPALKFYLGGSQGYGFIDGGLFIRGISGEGATYLYFVDPLNENVNSYIAQSSDGSMDIITYNYSALRLQSTLTSALYKFSVGSNADLGQFSVTSQHASNIVSIFKGAISQSANLAEWQNSSGSILSKVNKDGKISVPDEAFGSGWNSSVEVPTKNAIYDALTGSYVPYTGATTTVSLGKQDFYAKDIYAQYTDTMPNFPALDTALTVTMSTAGGSVGYPSFSENGSYSTFYSDGKTYEYVLIYYTAIGTDGVAVKGTWGDSTTLNNYALQVDIPYQSWESYYDFYVRETYPSTGGWYSKTGISSTGSTVTLICDDSSGWITGVFPPLIDDTTNYTVILYYNLLGQGYSPTPTTSTWYGTSTYQVITGLGCSWTNTGTIQNLSYIKIIGSDGFTTYSPYNVVALAPTSSSWDYYGSAFNLSDTTVTPNDYIQLNTVYSGTLSTKKIVDPLAYTTDGLITLGANSVSTTDSIVIGKSNATMVGTNVIAIGESNTNSAGNYAMMFGSGNTASNSYALTVGTGNVILGAYSGAFGINNYMTSSNSFNYGFGYGNTIASTYTQSFGIGYGTQVTASYSFAIGNSFTQSVASEIGLGVGAKQFGVGATVISYAPINLQKSVQFAYRAITALRTLDNTDYYIDCTANTFTVTLPTAASIAGRTYTIKNSGTGVITVGTTSSQTIDGITTRTLSTQYSAITVFSDGSNWKIQSS